MFSGKIDIVYLWVDGSDTKWLQQKNNWYQRIFNKVPVNDKELYRDNGELKYSLRSVAECAPWVNHIYIITGFNQIPKWLNTKNKKITIIPHEQILPKKAVPTFNSVSIEMCIPNIPNLSEYFIIMNDDTLFNKRIKPNFFFNSRNQPIIRYNKTKNHFKNVSEYLKKADTYTSTIILSEQVIGKLYNKNLYSLYPSHCIDPYKKSTWLECQSIPLISKQIKTQINNKFRTKNEFQRWLFNLYDFVNGYAVFKKAHGYKSGHHKILNFIYNTIHWYAVRHSPVFCFDAKESLLSITHSPIFCINDTRNSTTKTRKNNLQFLQHRFPHKSEFEK